jgi:hypothetical protein
MYYIKGSTKGVPNNHPIPKGKYVPHAPKRMTQQALLSMCFPTILAKAADILCGGVTPDDVLLYGTQQFKGGAAFAITGVPPVDVSTFINHYFKTVPFTGFTQAVDAGQMVLTNIIGG